MPLYKKTRVDLGPFGMHEVGAIKCLGKDHYLMRYNKYSIWEVINYGSDKQIFSEKHYTSDLMPSFLNILPSGHYVTAKCTKEAGKVYSGTFNEDDQIKFVSHILKYIAAKNEISSFFKSNTQLSPSLNTAVLEYYGDYQITPKVKM
jgi:hypothetical protein